MSRYSDASDDGYEGPPPWGRWEGASRQARRSRRGQAALRELIAALDAMNPQRLIAGALCHRGEVCALGALELYRRQTWTGETRREILKTLPQEPQRDQNRHTVPLSSDHNDGALGIDETARWGRDGLGLTYTLAWEIAYANDEIGFLGKPSHALTPEERWQSVRAWAVGELVEVTDGGTKAAS